MKVTSRISRFVVVRGLLLELAVALPVAVLPASAGEPAVAWQETFDTPAGPADANLFYEDRGSGKTGEAVIIKDIKDGVIRYGLKYDAARLQDRQNMLFGDCYWWEGLGTKWGPFDLKDYPFIEIRWRGEAWMFNYAVQTASGVRLPSYTWLPAARTEKDEQGREWKVSIMRVAPDSSLPTAGTPTKLLGINFVVMSPSNGKDFVTEIDYIRIRGANAEERAADERIVGALKDFPASRWRGFDSFFPFGTYFFYKRGDFESWNGSDQDYEGAYGTLARHRFNYVIDSDEVKLGRFGGQDGMKTFVDTWQKLVASARATGLKLGVGVGGLTDGRSVADGYEQYLPAARSVAAAFPSDDTVISWYVADEPSQSSLLPVVMATRAMREADPLQRPEVTVFNNAFAAQAYSAYLSLCMWDLYPILAGSREPWAIRDQAKAYRKVMPDKPMWVTLPAFETIPPAPKGSYLRPSDAEMRLMSYLALAEGAKGLIWFIDGMNDGNLVGFIDRVGQPRGGMIDTLADLSARLVPLGTLLLATDPVADATIEVKQGEPVAGEKGRGVSVSVLQHRSLPIRYLLAINEDLGAARSATVTLPAAEAGKKAGVYDLYSLEGADCRRGSSFTVRPLAGGDGRVYLLGSLKEFKRAKAQLQCTRALEDARALMPDLTIARRWKLPLSAVDRAMDTCRTLANAGDGPEALAAASTAKDLLERAMSDHSELNSARRALADIQIELAEIGPLAEYPSKDPTWWTGRNHPLLAPNPGFLDLAKRYWEVGRAYRGLYASYMQGNTNALWGSINTTRQDCLKVREDLLAMLRQKLQPPQEPAAK
jgi:hypothetical protein